MSVSREQSRTKATTTGRFFCLNFLDVAKDLRLRIKNSAEKPFVPTADKLPWVLAVARIYKYMNKKLPDDVCAMLDEEAGHEISNQKNFRYFYACLPISKKLCQVKRFAEERQKAISQKTTNGGKLKRAAVSLLSFTDDLELAKRLGFPEFDAFILSTVPSPEDYEKLQTELATVKTDLAAAKVELAVVTGQKDKLDELLEDFRNSIKQNNDTMEVMNAKLEDFMTAISKLKDSNTSQANDVTPLSKRHRSGG